eukprot:570604-Rhodomonas_salina.1
MLLPGGVRVDRPEDPVKPVAILKGPGTLRLCAGPKSDTTAAISNPDPNIKGECSKIKCEHYPSSFSGALYQEFLRLVAGVYPTKLKTRKTAFSRASSLYHACASMPAFLHGILCRRELWY